MNQSEKASLFTRLHVPGDPLVIYNIWDAGSAAAVAAAGAKALATGSWSVAGAQGYGDGQALPLSLLEQIVERIAASVDLPVSVDFEGAYAEAPAAAADNVGRLIDLGVVGINFEDQVVDGESTIYPIAQQQDRIRAIREKASSVLPDFFINARTDLFLHNPPDRHAGLVDAAIERGLAYAEAGGSGFFVPGLVDPALIEQVCRAVALPVNIMMSGSAPEVAVLKGLGVGRISYGPGPWRLAMAELTKRAAAVFG